MKNPYPLCSLSLHLTVYEYACQPSLSLTFLVTRSAACRSTYAVHGWVPGRIIIRLCGFIAHSLYTQTEPTVRSVMYIHHSFPTVLQRHGRKKRQRLTKSRLARWPKLRGERVWNVELDWCVIDGTIARDFTRAAGRGRGAPQAGRRSSRRALSSTRSASRDRSFFGGARASRPRARA